MKRTLSLLLLSLAVMLGFSMAAFAQDTITLTGVNGSNYGDVYTGIYYGTLTTPSGTTTNAPFVCDDYPDEISMGQSWTATAYNLNNLSGVRFQNPNGQTTLAAYAEVMWLAENIFSGTNMDGSGVTDSNVLSWAIWTILDNPGAGPSGTSTAVAAAEAWWASLSSSCTSSGAALVACGVVADYNIYTPNGEGGQEWLGPATTSEPLSMVLLGTFLTLGGIGLGKKKLFS